MVEAHFLRKPGQNEVDPATGEATSGQFESWTRFEIIGPELPQAMTAPLT